MIKYFIKSILISICIIAQLNYAIAATASLLPNAVQQFFDNNGNRIGYEVQSPQGVTNIFDNNGNRVGYSPSKKQ